ncbi:MULTISPECIES: hypothetical protein [Cyanophyceae]|uniref:hypothetical protein n=1 Tax=Cyanophyceae TaxID=3028117 RepID=UPI00168834B3|nr:hypothetical protein [Trichocoleus sp. FACHB-40]MBD2002715.1 hypothetical protein [Trichocoleus sp. FACHB-40]
MRWYTLEFGIPLPTNLVATELWSWLSRESCEINNFLFSVEYDARATTYEWDRNQPLCSSGHQYPQGMEILRWGKRHQADS